MPVKHHILPHKESKRRATLLQNKVILFYSVLTLFVFTFFKDIPASVPGVLGYASNINVSDLLKYTNTKRDAAGIGNLIVNTQLSAAAQKKAEHMFKNDYWAHIAPDGTDPWFFIVAEDYDYLYAGENLAKNFSNSKDVVDAWYKSPSHKENLLNEKYTDVGFATVNGILDGYETTLVVQLFGRTKNASPQIAVKGSDNSVLEKSTPVYTPKVQQIQPVETVQTVHPLINVYPTIKVFTIGFAGLLFMLFVLDMWYSRKHAILKFTGHSLAHTMFLLFAVLAIYISLAPGKII